MAIAAGQNALALARCEELQRRFGDRLYIELQRHGMASERTVEPALIELGYGRGIPLVATNEPFFATREDYEAHDALLCIAEGKLIADGDRRQLTAEHRFKSRAEMAQLFADLPEALAATVEIAERCAFRPVTLAPILPRFSAERGEGEMDEAQTLRRAAEAGLEQRLKRHGLAHGLTAEDYRERLAFELGVIERMKYSGYFLIVADFIQWAKGQGIPVGPGRGSGAGSLVAYALTITDLDPLRFGLLFERFLNPERVSMPDFDVDFCQDRRDEVIHYVQEQAMAATGSRKSSPSAPCRRAACCATSAACCRCPTARSTSCASSCRKIRRIRSRSSARSRTNRACRPSATAIPSPGAPSTSRKGSKACTAMPRPTPPASSSASGHLTELVPLYRDPKSLMPVTQFNMKWVEPAGLVKFDFLGLKTLTVLDLAVKLVRRRGIDLDLSSLPLDDAKTYEMLARGETVGVFQVESQGMRRALVDMRPDRFEDLIVLVALYRPGPMANIPTYCARKLGHERTDYLHPKLEPILQATYGIITYQEQVQQIARDLAGYSLGKADILRRAMGKKDRKEMASQRDSFISGAVERGIGRGDAEAIFDTCAKFAEYGFNKSHSAPYALLDLSDRLYEGELSGRVFGRLDDARHGQHRQARRIPRRGACGSASRSSRRRSIAPASSSMSRATPSITRSRRCAASAARPCKAFWTRAAKSRSPTWPISPAASIRARSTSACSKASPPRARSMRWSRTAPAALPRSISCWRRRSAPMTMRRSARTNCSAARRPRSRWRCRCSNRGCRRSGCRRNTTPSASSSPATRSTIMRRRLKRLRVQSWVEFARAVKAGAGGGRVAGTVISRTERRTRNGTKMGIIGLSDPSGHYEAVLFAEGLAQYRDLLEPGTAVLLFLTAEVQAEEVRARIQSVEPLDEAAAKMQKGLRVFLRNEAPIDGLVRRLEPTGASAATARIKSDGEVSMVLMLQNGSEVEVKLPGRFKVSPQIAGAIKAVAGVVTVEAL